MKHYKFGYVSILGRPNVGKSTILNRLIGQKIAITTDKAQTTRRRINGIFTNEEAQIVFVDTPGIHKPVDSLGEILVDEAKSATKDIDIVLFVVDGSTTSGRGDRWIVDNVISKTPVIPTFIIVNKSDLIKNDRLREENILTYKTLFNSNLPVIKISAKTGRNFDTLIKNIIRKLPEGEKCYDSEIITDENMRNIASELIREQILLNTHDEIPHSIRVDITDYKEEENIDKISANIVVEQDSQKAIVIGKGASMLKKIGTAARKEIEDVADKKVFLELIVKVEKNWRKNCKVKNL